MSVAFEMSGESPSQQRGVPLASTEPKVVLLMRLLDAIDEGRSSVDGLRRRIGGDHLPSTRTVRRYLDVLQEAGYPWYFDRGARVYRFPEGYVLRKPELSAGEIAGLLTLRGIAASLGRSLSAGVEKLTHRLVDDGTPAQAGRALPVRVQMADVELDGEHEQAFEQLQSAQREARRVEFAYVDKYGRRSERRVDIYGFIISSGRVYAIGQDVGKNAVRTFALDGISAVRVLSQGFTKPASFDLENFAAFSISGVHATDQPTAVTVRFSPVVAKAARAAGIVRDRTINAREDGGLEITYSVADPIEIIRWSLGWGTEAEITAPAAVRAQALALAQAIASRYAQEAGS